MTSKLRSECGASKTPANVSYQEALRKIYWAVKRRRSLIHGKLHEGAHHCAMGSFWEDNPKVITPAGLVDEVAAVNDSIPPTALPSERRRHVLRWLEWKIGL